MSKLNHTQYSWPINNSGNFKPAFSLQPADFKKVLPITY